ncbi:GntR family transcriptional regulator [Virgibacillus xinjiangensis]|uniref:GntR family transcriptional regulator n=1 Tax=Virgibacillus xinjiangensis TaxID=393090 RepID=A0ABV7CY48_9BACI
MRIEKQSISDQVLEHLRKKIILHEWREGDRLAEAQLSRELEVSRGPIREAIAKLEAENLVERHSNGRTVVKKFDTEDIINLYDSRMLLEKHALTQIDSSALQDHLRLMRLYIDQMHESFEAGVRDIDSDLAFHKLLVKMSKNQTLVQLWSSLEGIFRTLIDITSEVSVSESNQEKIIGYHKEVADALEAGEVEKAQGILAHHLKEASLYYCRGKNLHTGRDEDVTTKN